MTDDKKEFSGNEILPCHHVTTLSDCDRNIFPAMLDADDEPNERLIEAFKIHGQLIAE